MGEFLAGLLLTVIGGLLLIAGVAAAGHHIAYRLAFVVAAVLVFGGFVVFDSDWID